MTFTLAPKRSSRYNHQLPIYAGFHSNLYVRPLIIWGILAVIIICASSPATEHEHYHFDTLFNFLFPVTVIIGLAIFYNFLTSYRILLNEETLVFINLFGKPKESYLLKDIQTLKWNNKPRITRTRYGGQSRMKNEVIELIFDLKSIELSFDEYNNFDELKCYLYDYCLDHGKIKMRSLKERKRPSQKT